ncbi:MAG: CRISPR-associated protein Cas4 [archaeon YNP-LCB-003-016]|jgi:CRISPR-associated exonuclease Cas4|uniref:CRISPR-associated protein Cas4 n=1 Tax=Candidatus Culexarchaeum yellowstonense TaxID=2928963 RepID=UPI0026EF3F2C|nr:CRISPR-associated protein Cas4 [Candidatus Culexarchaeum yellowstonense]MCR6692163.1 CRISPR-associated protein Cas4 [Candidatus Culexarchaeum yellowstonense]
MVSDEIYIAQERAITGTLIWYYFTCKREVWLMSREITPDEDFSLLEMGRAVHEMFYQRMKKEVSLEGIKLDILMRENNVVCEVKTSSRFLRAAKFQLLYYLYRLEEMGLKMQGEIRIPKERKRIVVFLDKENKNALMDALNEIKKIINAEKPPEPIRIPYCRKCAYKDFCWV